MAQFGISWTDDDRRRRSLLFLKCCSGGVWGGEALPGISVTRAMPPGGSRGAEPLSGISVTRALPPQRPCLAPNFFSSEIFFDRIFFWPKFFWRNLFSFEIFFVRTFSSDFLSFVVCSSSVRPSVRPSENLVVPLLRATVTTKCLSPLSALRSSLGDYCGL